MDGWMEKLIRCGLGNLLVPPGKKMVILYVYLQMVKEITNTPAVRGLGELFSTGLERFLQPIQALHVSSKN
jgi:hypothetical protein